MALVLCQLLGCINQRTTFVMWVILHDVLSSNSCCSLIELLEHVNFGFHDPELLPLPLCLPGKCREHGAEALACLLGQLCIEDWCSNEHVEVIQVDLFYICMFFSTQISTDVQIQIHTDLEVIQVDHALEDSVAVWSLQLLMHLLCKLKTKGHQVSALCPLHLQLGRFGAK